jgi:hypothetical protein
VGPRPNHYCVRVDFENEAGREVDDGGIPTGISDVQAPSKGSDTWALIASR